MSSNVKTEELIEVPGAPEIPGLRFRKFGGEHDFEPMARVLQAADPADGRDRFSTAEALSKQYAFLKNSDAANDMVMIEVDGELIGYKRVEWHQELDGTRVYIHFGFLHPDWRGRGIGAALIRHSEARLRELAASHPDTGPKLLESWAASKQDDVRNLLESEGYEVARNMYEMLRPNLDDIPDVPLPEGFEVRPVRTEDYPAVWAAEVEAFRDHWGADETDDKDFERWLTQEPFQPELWQVAWDTATGEVAGMVRTIIDEKSNQAQNRKLGWTENISVRRPWRKRGLARALMARSMRLQKELGMTETALGVDALNPSGALQLYKNMGFEVIKTESTYRKPL